MRRKLPSNGFEIAALVALSAVAATVPAQASQLFAFNYSLPGTGPTPLAVSASGFFATTDLSGGSYTVTGVWGTWNGVAITGIAPPGGFGGNDNLLFPAAPLVDFNGLGFTVNGAGDDGAGDVNLFYIGTGYTENSASVGVGSDFSITPATPTPVFFNFSYSLPGVGATPMPVSAGGTLTTVQTDANTYLVGAITGNWNGVSILNLLSPGGFGGNDNLIFPVGNHVTGNGLSCAVSGVGDDGAGNVNVFLVGAGSYREFSPDVGVGQDFNLSPVPNQIPEPASVTLMYTGIPVLLFLVRRRSRAQKPTE
jgi:hypothetical protein